MNEEIDPNVLRHYEIIQKINTGKSSLVWKAIDRQTNKLIALKKVG